MQFRLTGSPCSVYCPAQLCAGQFALCELVGSVSPLRPTAPAGRHFTCHQPIRYAPETVGMRKTPAGTPLCLTCFVARGEQRPLHLRQQRNTAVRRCKPGPRLDYRICRQASRAALSIGALAFMFLPGPVMPLDAWPRLDHTAPGIPGAVSQSRFCSARGFCSQPCPDRSNTSVPESSARGYPDTLIQSLYLQKLVPAGRLDCGRRRSLCGSEKSSRRSCGTEP